MPHITQHIHLATIDSTQNYLRDNFNGGNVLVSTGEQTSGFGRQGKLWIHQKESLAFSFTLKPGEVATLTPLEVAVLISDFFKKIFSLELKLKWPNDLLNEKGEKCGGILIQNIDGVLMVGVGINLTLGRPIKERTFYPAGSLKITRVSVRNLSRDIYEYILKHRLNPTIIKKSWAEKCIHMDATVQIDKLTGVFKGLGPMGEALVFNGEVVSVYSGQLSPLT